MKDVLIIEGKEYISSRRAAEMTKYSNDYIGQLCRQGKVLSRRVGRAWFIDANDLMCYKKTSDDNFFLKQKNSSFSPSAPKVKNNNDLANTTKHLLLSSPKIVSKPDLTKTIIPEIVQEIKNDTKFVVGEKINTEETKKDNISLNSEIIPILWSVRHFDKKSHAIKSISGPSQYEKIFEKSTDVIGHIRNRVRSSYPNVSRSFAVLSFVFVLSLFSTVSMYSISHPFVANNFIDKNKSIINSIYSKISVASNSGYEYFVPNEFTANIFDSFYNNVHSFANNSKTGIIRLVKNWLGISDVAYQTDSSSEGTSTPISTIIKITKTNNDSNYNNYHSNTHSSDDSSIANSFILGRISNLENELAGFRFTQNEQNYRVGENIGRAISGLNISNTASDLSNISGTLSVSKGGTGVNSFSGGWLYSGGGDVGLVSSSSPTVSYITAISTNSTSTFSGGLSILNGLGLSVLQNSNVGIGTTSPLAKLDIFGDAIISGSNRYLNFGPVSGNSGYGLRDNAGVMEFKSSGGIWMPVGSGSGSGSDSNWSFFNNSAIRLATSTNTVLIGANSTTTNSKLEVIGSGYFSSGLTLGSYNGPLQANNGLVSATTSIGVIYGGTGITSAPSYGQLLMGNSSSGYNLTATSSLGLVGLGVINSLSSNYLPKWNGSSLVNSNMYDNGNNVGIGTSSPYSILSISNSASTPANTPLLTIASTTNGTATTTLLSVESSGQVLVGKSGSVNYPAIAFANDNDGTGTGIYQSGTNYLSFATNGGTRFEIDGAGNVKSMVNWINRSYQVFQWGNGSVGTVDLGLSRFAPGVLALGTGAANDYGGTLLTKNIGLGTTSPYAKLSVSANASDTYNPVLFAIASSTGGTSTTTAFTVLANGNVGIGTVSPTQKLEITGNAAVSGTLYLPIWVDWNGGIANSYIQQGGAGKYLSFGTNNSENMRIISGGNLGLGTTSPYAKLSVSANASDTYNPVLFAIASSTGGTSTTTAFTVLANGNVGIGTSSPESMLDVDGVATFGTENASASQLIVKGGAGGGPIIKLVRTSGGSNSYAWSLAGGGLSFQDLISSGNPVVGTFYGNSSANELYLGQKTAATVNTIPSILAASSFAVSAGANVNANDLRIIGGMGVGGGTPGNITFWTGSSTPASTAHSAIQRLTIMNQTGNIGIGTTSPNSILSISNSAATPVNTSLLTISSTTAGTATSTLFTVLANGYVGTGIDTPLYPLDINVPTGNASLRFKTRDPSNAKTAGIILENGSGGTQYSDISFTQAGSNSLTIFSHYVSDNNIIRFNVGNSNPLNLMGSGNVGIGTTSPYARLSISSNSTDTYTPVLFSIASSTGGTSTTTAFTVLANGNVGVGTTNPAPTSAIRRVLNIYDTVNGSELRLDGGSTIMRMVANNSVAYIGTNSATDLSLQTQGLTRLTIGGTTGYVGIGTTSPYANLSVSANASDTYNPVLFAIASSTNGTSTSTPFTVLANGNVGVSNSNPSVLLDIGKSDGTTGTAAHFLGGNSATDLVTFERTDFAGKYSIYLPLGQFTVKDVTNSRDLMALVYSNPGSGSMNQILTGRDQGANANNGLSGMLRSINAGTTGTDTYGGDLYIASGKGNGAGALSNIFFQTPNLTVSGTTQQSYSTKMTLSGNGNLGLGTTSPYAKLSVAGSAGQTTPIFALSTSTSGFATSTAFVIDSNGRVGVGTTSPMSTVALYDSNPQVSYSNGTVLGYTGIDSPASTLDIGTYTNHDVKIETNNVERVRISNSGYVGIGTSSPLTSLHIAGTTANNNLTVDTGINFSVVQTPNAPSLALAGQGAGNVDNGQHSYYVTYYTARGETNISSRATFSVTDKTIDGKVVVTIPTIQDYRVVGRKIYRSKSPDTAYYNAYLLATIADNTTTTYTDNIADSSLGGNTAYWRPNTTNSMLTINGGSALVIDTMNTILGLQSGINLATGGGGDNVLMGYLAGQNMQSSDRNIAVGRAALNALTAGEGNVGIGYNAGSSNQTGNYGVYIGYNTGKQNGASSNNVMVGGFAGQVASALSTEVFLGYAAGRYETNSSRLIIDAIDRGDVTSSQSGALLYGTFSATPANQSLILGGGGKVGIGTTSPYSILSISNSVATPVNTSLLTISSTTAGTATSTLFTVLANGKVGIGISAPTDALDVSGNIKTTGRTYHTFGGVAAFPAVSFTSNSSNPVSYVPGFYSPGIDQIAFSTKGVNYLMLDSNGNIGLGTTSPYAKLSVSANASDTYNPVLFAIASSTNGTSTSTPFTVLANGNVGIGTTSPSGALQVIGKTYLTNGSATGGLVLGADVNASTLSANTRKLARITMPTYVDPSVNSLIFAGDNDNGTNNVYFGGSPGASIYAATNIAFYTAATAAVNGGTERMRIDNSGNVGIGTSTLYAKFSVAGTAGQTAPIFALSTSTSGFATSTAFVIDANGSLGIGTATPSAPIDMWVGGSSKFSVDNTGMVRALNFYAPAGFLESNQNKVTFITAQGGNNASITVGSARTYDAADKLAVNMTPQTVSNSSGGFTGVRISPIYNQSGTASSTDLQILRTETTLGSGTELLIQAGTTTNANLFNVNNQGSGYFARGLGIGTTSPAAILGINGNMYIGGSATSTIEGNLDVRGTLHGQILYSGDLFFANNFSFTEAPLDGTTQGLLLRNQNGQDSMSIDDKGNLSLAGDICYKGRQCFGKSINSLESYVNSLASSTAESLFQSEASTTKSLNELTVSVDEIKNSILDLNSRFNNISTTTLELLSSSSLITSLASTTAEDLASSTSFIARISSAVIEYIQSSAGWVFTKINSALAIFDRVETKTASVSNGLEMLDQNTNEIYCVQIKNGEFAKTKGSCNSSGNSNNNVSTSTQPQTIVLPVINNNNNTLNTVTATSSDNSSLQNSNSTTTSNPVLTSTSTPVLTPEGGTNPSTTTVETTVVAPTNSSTNTTSPDTSSGTKNNTQNPISTSVQEPQVNTNNGSNTSDSTNVQPATNNAPAPSSDSSQAGN